MGESARRTSPLFRFVIALGAILSFLAGIQLYVLSERTEDYFAWTIAVPPSAALLGAFYWSAVIAILSSCAANGSARVSACKASSFSSGPAFGTFAPVGAVYAVALGPLFTLGVVGMLRGRSAPTA